jgi:uncharacterized membrane protein YbhN (UPF0104 family)
VKIPTFAELCAVMPIVNTITSLPISFGGIGVREGLFHVFLSNLAGVSEGIAVAISSTGYLLTLALGCSAVCSICFTARRITLSSRRCVRR